MNSRLPFVLIMDALLLVALAAALRDILLRRNAYAHWKRVTGVISDTNRRTTRSRREWFYSYSYGGGKYHGKDDELPGLWQVTSGSKIQLLVNPKKPQQSYACAKHFGFKSTSSFLLGCYYVGMLLLLNLAYLSTHVHGPSAGTP